MNENYTEQKEQQPVSQQDTPAEEDSLPVEALPTAEENTEEMGTSETSETSESPKPPKKKLSKKKLIIIGAIAVVVIAVAAIILIPSKFERVKHECVQIAGVVTSGKGYFRLDTDPDEWENMDPTIKAIMMSGQQQKTLEAIRYANDALGFNGSVYNKMMETTALMGRQTEETSKYRVSWTYHPDDGLEVTYEKK